MKDIPIKNISFIILSFALYIMFRVIHYLWMDKRRFFLESKEDENNQMLFSSILFFYINEQSKNVIQFNNVCKKVFALSK